MNKYIIFGFNTPNQQIKEAIEEPVPEGEISLIKLIWYMLFERNFKYEFTETVKYALRHHYSYRGTGATEVMLLQSRKGFSKIWKKKK
ncbi:MAG: hypothetical protein E6R13_03135 [Spirochaetes bacterium]|nr:MAG: hypothetical protein E6R13_03135 [Spirochaetota bacterium]